MANEQPVAEYYSLTVTADLAGLSPARIRLYERAGMIAPVRRIGRSRLYGEAELARLRRLRRLATDLGLNAAGLEVVVRLLDELEALRAEVKALRPGGRAASG